MSRRNLTQFPIIALISSLFMIAGCGRTDGPKLSPVSGTVVLNGEPVAGARVEFNPLKRELLDISGEGRKKKSNSTPSGSFGITDHEGHFELHYGLGRRGAVQGEHQVRITTLSVDRDNPKSSRETIPRNYNTATQLTYTVDDGDNVAEFTLEAKPLTTKKLTANAKR